MELSRLIFILIFQEVTFRARKIKKTDSEKLLIFWEMELSSSKLKKLLIFHEGNLQGLKIKNFLYFFKSSNKSRSLNL